MQSCKHLVSALQHRGPLGAHHVQASKSGSPLPCSPCRLLPSPAAQRCCHALQRAAWRTAHCHSCLQRLCSSCSCTRCGLIGHRHGPGRHRASLQPRPGGCADQGARPGWSLERGACGRPCLLERSAHRAWPVCAAQPARHNRHAPHVQRACSHARALLCQWPACSHSRWPAVTRRQARRSARRSEVQQAHLAIAVCIVRGHPLHRVSDSVDEACSARSCRSSRQQAGRGCLAARLVCHALPGSGQRA